MPLPPPQPPATKKADFDDLVFVTSGGVARETAPFCEDLTIGQDVRPKTTPFVSGKRADIPGFAAAGLLTNSLLRRRAKTADAVSLARLRFRSEPIRSLVSATLRSIDPSGTFNMYQEWSHVKNRVLSSKFAFFALREDVFFSRGGAGNPFPRFTLPLFLVHRFEPGSLPHAFRAYSMTVAILLSFFPFFRSILSSGTWGKVKLNAFTTGNLFWGVKFT